MKVKVNDIEVSPKSIAVMGLNFGQERMYKDKHLYLCSIIFPESIVKEELKRFFYEIKEDVIFFEESWDEDWAIKLSQYSSFYEFKKDFSIDHYISFLKFISFDLLNKLALDKHLGGDDIPTYVFCELIKRNVKLHKSHIEISGLCYEYKKRH